MAKRTAGTSSFSEQAVDARVPTGNGSMICKLTKIHSFKAMVFPVVM